MTDFEKQFIRGIGFDQWRGCVSAFGVSWMGSTATTASCDWFLDVLVERWSCGNIKRRGFRVSTCWASGAVGYQAAILRVSSLWTLAVVGFQAAVLPSLVWASFEVVRWLLRTVATGLSHDFGYRVAFVLSLDGCFDVYVLLFWHDAFGFLAGQEWLFDPAFSSPRYFWYISSQGFCNLSLMYFPASRYCIPTSRFHVRRSLVWSSPPQLRSLLTLLCIPTQSVRVTSALLRASGSLSRL